MKHSKILILTQCALFAALLCVLSPIAVPIGPVPVTLGLFAVMLCGVVLGSLRGTVSVAVYLLIGVLGLPVFSGAMGGASRLVGPTGGYLWGYLLCTLLIGLRRYLPAKRLFSEMAIAFFFCLFALAAVYLCGTVQYSLYAGISFSEALKIAVFPFVLIDLAKCLAAAVLGVLLCRTLRKAELL